MMMVVNALVRSRVCSSSGAAAATTMYTGMAANAMKSVLAGHARLLSAVAKSSGATRRAGSGSGSGSGSGKATTNAATEEPSSSASALTVSTSERRVVGLPRPPWTPSRDLDKTKTHMKRAGYMMRVLDHEQQVNSPNFKKFPHFSAGDVLEVALQSVGNRSRTTTFRGIVIARRNKGIASNFTLRNVVQGMEIERTLPLYSPHLISLKLLEKRSARRAKLYYLRDKEIRYSKV